MVPLFVLAWGLSFGPVPQQVYVMQVPETGEFIQQDFNSHLDATLAEIDLSLTLAGHVKFFTSVGTYQSIGTMAFKPYRADYTVGFDFKIVDNIHVLMDHTCIHPVSSGNVTGGMFNTPVTFGANETRLLVRISGSQQF